MKKRIAFVINSLSGGGAERTAANLSRYLSERYEIDIIVNDNAIPQYAYEGKIISLGMPATKNRMNTAYQLKALRKRIRLLRRLKEEKQYMAVLSFSEMTNLANVLTGGKAIISVHNSDWLDQSADWKRRLTADCTFPYMFRKACRTVSCSAEIADELVKRYRLPEERSSVIYNGIEYEKIREKAFIHDRNHLCEDRERLIISVGRLTAEKGQWHLIRAFKKLHDDGLNAKLVILGEGELRGPLEQLITEGNLDNKVILPGFVENPEKFMASADAVVFPSLHEGFSNAIVEALACGAAVVSTDHVTGAREILAPDTDYHNKVYDRIDEAQYGILVPVCDGKTRHMDEPLTKEELLLADAIRRMVTDQQWSDHYRKVAPKRAEQLEIRSIVEAWTRVIEKG